MPRSHLRRPDPPADTTGNGRLDPCLAAVATGLVIGIIALLVLRQIRPGVLPGNDALLILPAPILVALLAGLTWPVHRRPGTREHN